MRMNKKKPTANCTKRISCISKTFIITAVLVMFSFFSVKEVNAQTGSKVDEIYNNMTQKQRIAQMFMIQARDWEDQGAVTELPQELKELYSTYRFGAFISGKANMRDTLQMLNLSKDIQDAVTSVGGVPMIIAAEQEGGSVYQIITGTPMPGNMAVAATGDPANAKIAGRVIGEELDALGFNCTLAPNLGICDPDNSITDVRYFSDSPDSVEVYASKFSEGLKSKNIIGCIKYFPGWTGNNSSTVCPVVDKSWNELLNFELKPFKIAIEKGADMVMVSHVIYPQIDNNPATLSGIIMADKLRDELGFDGVICTDSMAAASIIASIPDSKERVVQAINAGADLVCMPLTDAEMNTPKEFSDNFDALIDYVDNNVPDNRIEDAVKRILTLKEKKGILDYDESEYTEVRALDTVGSSEFRQTERDMAADGVTLVKNTGNVLPLITDTSSNILILVQDQNDENYAAQFIYSWNRAKERGLVAGGANINVVMFDEHNWDDLDKLAVIDAADTVIMNSNVSTKDDMANPTWRIRAPQKYTEYAKDRGKKSIVISMDAPYDVQLYPNADAILAVYNPAGSQEEWQTVLSNGATGSSKALGANLVAAMEVALGNYGAIGKLPVDIYEFVTSSASFSEEKVYNSGYGIEYDPITNMDKVEIFLEFTQAAYSGEAICPMVVIKVETKRGTKVLTEGKDYSVAYLNNINVGTATARITGMGSYIGQKNVNFEIISDMFSPSEENTDLESPQTGVALSSELFLELAIILFCIFAILIIRKKEH